MNFGESDSARSPAPATTALVLRHVTVRDVRNVVRAELEPSPRINVLSGPNGHGKTTVLEAIYLAATSRSFRTTRLAELVRHDATAASVRARFVEHNPAVGPRAALEREQVAAIEGGRCHVRLDGNRPKRLADFATHSPVIVFHPGEIALSSGPAALRRRLLDRVALFIDPTNADHRTRYAEAHRARQQLLRRRDTGRDAGELEAFEQLCAVHGAALTAARRAACDLLVEALGGAFARIAAADLVLVARYEPGGDDDVDRARRELETARARDAYRKTSGFGPHRDELALELGGHPARSVASQGQHRALTLALKAAEAAAVRTVRGVEPVLLLDDVSSELDADRSAALLRFLTFAGGQMFLTTTRPELIATPDALVAERRDFALDRGAVRSVERPR